MYVEERMLRHIMEWQFVEYVKEQFNKLLKERLSEADTQVDPP